MRKRERGLAAFGRTVLCFSVWKGPGGMPGQAERAPAGKDGQTAQPPEGGERLRWVQKKPVPFVVRGRKKPRVSNRNGLSVL